MKIPHVLFTHLPPFTELQCFFQQSHPTTTGLREIRQNGRGKMRDDVSFIVLFAASRVFKLYTSIILL